MLRFMAMVLLVILILIAVLVGYVLQKLELYERAIDDTYADLLLMELSSDKVELKQMIDRLERVRK